MMFKLSAVIILVITGFVSSARAHEFWIEPLTFTAPSGEAIAAHNRLGQMLKGDEGPYLESLFREFTLTDQDGTREVPGREDQALGMRIELVALTNPYVDQGPMQVQVLFEKSPLADVQIAIFRRDAENNVTRETLRSDREGRAVIPNKGAPITLLSAVHMVEPDEDLAARKEVVWHSLWASLTYGAP